MLQEIEHLKRTLVQDEVHTIAQRTRRHWYDEHFKSISRASEAFWKKLKFSDGEVILKLDGYLAVDLHDSVGQIARRLRERAVSCSSS
jgi:hypothetical protein